MTAETGDTSSYSRGANGVRALLQTSSLGKQRAQGMPGAGRTRSLVCVMEKAYERSHHRYAEITPAFPARWFERLLRDLPGEPGFFATVACGSSPANLTPASGCQDHTASP